MTQPGSAEGYGLSDPELEALLNNDPFNDILQQSGLEQGILSSSETSSGDIVGSSRAAERPSDTSGTQHLARHAEEEARRFQLRETERREKNRAAQAAFRQRKRVSRPRSCHVFLSFKSTLHLRLHLQERDKQQRRHLQAAALRLLHLEREVQEQRAARAAAVEVCAFERLYSAVISAACRLSSPQAPSQAKPLWCHAG